MHAVDAMPFATQGPWFCAAVQMKFATTVQVLLECSVFICEKGALVAGIHAATAPLLVRLPILPLPMFMSATWVPGKSCSVCSWQCVLMAVLCCGHKLAQMHFWLTFGARPLNAGRVVEWAAHTSLFKRVFLLFCILLLRPSIASFHLHPSILHPSAIPHWCYCNQVNVSFYFAMLLLFCNGAMFLLFCNGAMFLLFCNGTLLFCNGTIPHCCTCNQVNVCKLLIQACFKRVLLLFCIGTLQPFHTAVLATRSMFASCSYKPVLKECSFYFALIQHCDGS